jgi:hypothetical protein
MNNGFFGFPSPIGISNNILDIKEFEVSGVYEIPPDAKLLYILCVGAGSGGGGGGRQTPTAGGGSGGMGGKILSNFYSVQALGFPINRGSTTFFGNVTSPYQRLIITIGAGGNGGDGATTNSSSGSNGAVGGSSGVNISGYASGTNGSLLWVEGAAVNGGNTGQGGTTTVGAVSGSGRAHWLGFYANTFLGNGSTATANGGAGTAITAINVQYNGGGGGGGYNGTTATAGANITPVASTNTAQSGVMNPNYVRASALLSGGSANTAGQDALGYTILNKYSNGFGGAGGGGSAGASAAGRGGNGWRGGGGGGGGGSLNGANGGNGGKGGDGYCLIIAYG